MMKDYDDAFLQEDLMFWIENLIHVLKIYDNSQMKEQHSNLIF